MPITQTTNKVSPTPQLPPPTNFYNLGNVARWAASQYTLLMQAFSEHAFMINKSVQIDGSQTFTGPQGMAPVAVADLTSYPPSAGSIVWVPNAAGTPVLAYGDGSSWRRVDTNAVVT